MGEILGLGCTHYPGLLLPHERLPGGFHHLLTAPNVPAWAKDRASWPDPLLAELGNDAGVSAGRRHGTRMADGFRSVRAALDVKSRPSATPPLERHNPLELLRKLTY